MEQEVTGGGIPAAILRLPMVYGPNDRQHRLYSYLKRMADNRPAILLDPIRAEWRGIRGYRDNCAHAIALAVTNPNSAGRLYNVGEPHALTETQWITALAAIVGWGGEVVAVQNNQLPDYLQTPLDWSCHLDIDSSRLRAELGFDEPVDLDESLHRTVAWELRNPPSEPSDKFDYRAENLILSAVDTGF